MMFGSSGAFALFNMTAVTMQQRLDPRRAARPGHQPVRHRGTRRRGPGRHRRRRPGRHRRDTRTHAGRSRAHRRRDDRARLAAPPRGTCVNPNPPVLRQGAEVWRRVSPGKSAVKGGACAIASASAEGAPDPGRGRPGHAPRRQPRRRGGAGRASPAGGRRNLAAELRESGTRIVSCPSGSGLQARPRGRRPPVDGGLQRRAPGPRSAVIRSGQSPAAPAPGNPGRGMTAFPPGLIAASARVSCGASAVPDAHGVRSARWMAVRWCPGTTNGASTMRNAIPGRAAGSPVGQGRNWLGAAR